MNVFRKLNLTELQDRITELSIMADRIGVMLSDILNDLLYPLNPVEGKSPTDLAMIATIEAHRSMVKTELADCVLDEVKDKLKQLGDLTHQEPMDADEVPYDTAADHRYYQFTDDEVSLIRDALADREGPLADSLKEVFSAFETDTSPNGSTPHKGHVGDAGAHDGEPSEDEVKESMMDDYMIQINTCISIIETRHDFISRMRKLIQTAMNLAAGD